MQNPFNIEQDEIFYLSSENQSKSQIDIESFLFKDSFENSPLNIFSSFVQSKKPFITTKNKTSFIIYKQKDRKHKKISNNNSFLKGRWTKQERIKFAFALYKFGTNWNKIKRYIASRNMSQLRSHSQKFLERIKYDEFIIQKGFELKNYNWKETIDFLRNNLKEDELLKFLYSVESELGDNKRRTEKYLERKRKELNVNINEEGAINGTSTIEEGSINSSTNISNEFNINKKNENENYDYLDIISLDEENNFKIDLYKNHFCKSGDNTNNIFEKQISKDEISFDSECDSSEKKCKFKFLENMLRL